VQDPSSPGETSDTLFRLSVGRLISSLCLSLKKISDRVWSPGLEWRTVPRKRHFCACLMASCAWEGLGPAGFPFPGRPTCVRFATYSTMFVIAPDIDTETPLAHACESLASASVMANDFAAFL